MKETFKNRFDDLVKDITNELKIRVIESKTKSKYVDCNCINLDELGFDYDELGFDYDYVELVIIDGLLHFIDSDGYHYSLFEDCDLTDLIPLVDF